MINRYTNYFVAFALGVLLSSNLIAQASKTVVSSSKALSTVAFSTKGFPKPKGGHLQGIQQLSKRHLVISGSSKTMAYFFIVEWENEISAEKQGKIIKFVNINDDFQGMRHNHAGGIQLLGHYLAIGTEGGKDQHKSSVVFYDLSDPQHPKPLSLKIDRSHDTAGAVGITRLSDDTVLLAVGGWDADQIDFYSNHQFPEEAFNKLFSYTIQSFSKELKDHWGSYQNINLVAHEKEVVLWGFCRKGKDNLIDRHSLDQSDQISSYFPTPIDRMVVDCGAHFSFRYGGGQSLIDKEVSAVWVIPRNWKRVVSVGWFTVKKAESQKL